MNDQEVATPPEPTPTGSPSADTGKSCRDVIDSDKYADVACSGSTLGLC